MSQEFKSNRYQTPSMFNDRNRKPYRQPNYGAKSFPRKPPVQKKPVKPKGPYTPKEYHRLFLETAVMKILGEKPEFVPLAPTPQSIQKLSIEDPTKLVVVDLYSGPFLGTYWGLFRRGNGKVFLKLGNYYHLAAENPRKPYSAAKDYESKNIPLDDIVEDRCYLLVE